nr:MAG: hypothetical protein TU35_06655 [Thermoproteus sp. AZ2]
MSLFDASAIVNLLKRGRASVFVGGYTIELARYEAANAIWKEQRIGKLDEETALRFLSLIRKALEILEVVPIAGLEEGIYRLAVGEGLTFYDAAYLYVAIHNKLALVTDDVELRERGAKYVVAKASSDLA